MFRIALVLTILAQAALVSAPVRAQNRPYPLTQAQRERFERAPLPAIEAELRPIAVSILTAPGLARKDSLNRIFEAAMRIVLARPESYAYPFDSLKTISGLKPEDERFRIFTWYVASQDGMGRSLDHTYYGVVQRLWRGTPKNPQEVVVIPLRDTMDMSARVESQALGPNEWFGALYYHPKESKAGVLTYKGKIRRTDGMTGKLRKEKATYYVLLGWNGHDAGSSYKIIESIILDPEKPDGLTFGAPIFYFGNVARTRAVFKYSENAPFHLNKGYVVDRIWGTRRKLPMIIWDHLDKPRSARPTDRWSAGPDGSYDGFYYFNRVMDDRKGFFYYLRDVRIYAEHTEHYNPRKIRRDALREKRRLLQRGIDFDTKAR